MKDTATKQGHCSRCGKVWTLDTGQGVCQWCGKQASCQTRATTRATTRAIKSGHRRSSRDDDSQALDQSYDQLQGEWLDWLDTARAYDHSIPQQDQFDLRHDILLELARAKARDKKPLPKLRQYRIASITRIHYWRDRGKGQSAVCIFAGIAKALHCKECDQKPEHGTCPYRAVRPLLSLDLEVEDSEGGTATLADTIADDNALDLEAWQDAVIWRINSPIRLVQIAYKIENDISLSGAERKYLWKWRQREQNKLL